MNFLWNLVKTVKSAQNCERLKLWNLVKIDRWDGWTDVYISDFKYHESRTVLIKTPVKGSSYARFQHLLMQLNICEYFRISSQGETRGQYLLQYVAGGAIRSTWCFCQTTCYPDKSRMQIMCLSEFAQTQCNAFMPCCHIIVKQWHKQGCIHSAFKPKAKRLQSIIDQKWKSRIRYSFFW